MAIVIEKGVPIGKAASKYQEVLDAFASMGAGDSFVLPIAPERTYSSSRNLITSALTHKFRGRFLIRKDVGGMRVFKKKRGLQ